VRTTRPVGNAGPIHFIINTKGEYIDRVQLPEGRLIASFGKSGDVYMALRDAEGNARVEQSKVRQRAAGHRQRGGGSTRLSAILRTLHAEIPWLSPAHSG
jgi:hypothetical protein